ncbi:type II secretion system protein [Vibrio cidicii]|uniref:type II secretion system protein n=1 Tax=Vibrio cidicii TaxID=1763883 RepID=UPI003F510F29
MKRQGGFTLIELVVVIVILGILAVTAAPRFLNLQGDAREASLQGLKGAIDGAAGIAYGKAAIAGLDSASTATNLTGVPNGQVIFGYPTATSTSLGAFVNGLAQDWTASGGADTAGATVRFSFIGNTNWAAAPNGCYVQYQAAQSTTSSAVTTVVDGGC